MYYYFSSDYPALLKINGTFYGNVYKTVKHLDILGKVEGSIVQVMPLIPTERQVTLILNSDLIINPPNNVSLTDLDGGYLIKFSPTFDTQDYLVLAQKKFDNSLITVFNDNGHKVCIENGLDFYSERIFHDVKEAQIVRGVCAFPNLIAVIFKGENFLVNVYDVKEKVTKLFSKLCDGVEFNDNIMIKQNFLDIAKHTLTSYYLFDGITFNLSNSILSVSSEFDLSLLNPSILPYAFLEHFMLGGDISEYVTQNILDNKEYLRSYFGDFVGVFPPPLFKDIKDVGVIYHERDNIYSVKYFSFEIKDRKIVNFRCKDK
jgi:hypothetical protein